MTLMETVGASRCAMALMVSKTHKLKPLKPFQVNEVVSSPAPGTAPADGGTQRVGSLAPNGFGLYDMYGNVSEWCVDCYHEDNYGQARTAGEAIDPCNWANPMTEAGDANKNNTYIRRGGGWRDAAAYGRSAARWYWNSGVNSVGFRVMCHGPVAAQD